MFKDSADKTGTLLIRGAVIFFICVVIAAYFLIHNQANDIIQNREVHGRITDIYEEHGKAADIIKVDSAYTINTGTRVTSLMAIGDSLFKQKGDSFYTVKKQLTGRILKFYPKKY